MGDSMFIIIRDQDSLENNNALLTRETRERNVILHRSNFVHFEPLCMFSTVPCLKSSTFGLLYEYRNRCAEVEGLAIAPFARHTHPIKVEKYASLLEGLLKHYLISTTAGTNKISLSSLC